MKQQLRCTLLDKVFLIEIESFLGFKTKFVNVKIMVNFYIQYIISFCRQKN